MVGSFTNDADNRFIAGLLDPFGVRQFPITPSGRYQNKM
jgi:hypothetical protein